MAGIFKKFSANDIKITPFEAHKQYNTTNLASIGASTESLAWSGVSKNTFSTGSRLYYQIDKLYYRNYINERAHRLEIDSANYKVQERRLYQSASLLSLSQKTFGSQIQPGTFELSGSKGSTQFNLKDDGYGNLYDINLGKDNFPDEKHRVFYLAPVKGFKRSDLTLNYETGNTYINTPFSGGYSGTIIDDSYFQNKVTFFNNAFVKLGQSTTGLFNTPYITQNSKTDSRITIKNAPYLNFNEGDFAISFYFIPGSDMPIALSSTPRYILTKEGAQDSFPLGSEAGGNYSTSTSGALDITTTPAANRFPYRLTLSGSNVGVPTNDFAATGSLVFERFDGDIKSSVAGVVFLSASSNVNVPIHVLVQKSGDNLVIYKNGTQVATSSDLTTGTCQNNSDITIFKKQNPDGTYSSISSSATAEAAWAGQLSEQGDGFAIQQLQMWDKALTETEIQMVSESFTGTYPVGNLFYDNGFATITHPKYMDVFNGGELNTLKYKNTHLITENEYQCNVKEEEFEFTTNKTALKVSPNNEVADFTTGSAFKPYVTTVGLYNNNGELLVVGKLGQPIRKSSETETTFVIRFDT